MNRDFVTLIFGASLKPVRYSNIVIHRLRSYNFPCIGMGLHIGMVADVNIIKFNHEISDVHTVTMYMNAKRQEEYHDLILSLDPKRIIFNPGAENRKLYNIAQQKGIIVENACTLVLLSMGVF